MLSLATAGLIGLGGLSYLVYNKNDSGNLVSIKTFNPLNIEATKRPLKKIQKLFVNTSKEYRAFADKNEEEGLRDIRDLTLSSPLEEEWLYLPQEKKWYETGVSEVVDTSNNFAQGACITDPTGLEEILAKQPEIIFYHFHPLHRDLMLTNSKKIITDLSMQTYLRQNELSVLEGKISEFFVMLGSCPSDKDILKMIRNKIINRSQQEVKIGFKVCSYYGVYEYGLTPQGLKRFSNYDEPTSIFKDQKIIDMSEVYNNKIGAYVGKDSALVKFLSATELITPYKEYASYLSDDNIKVTFTPFKEIEK